MPTAGSPRRCRPNVANTAAYAMQGVITGDGTAIASNPHDGTPYIAKTGTTDTSRAHLDGRILDRGVDRGLGRQHQGQRRRCGRSRSNGTQRVRPSPRHLQADRPSRSTRLYRGRAFPAPDPQAAHREPGVRAGQPGRHDAGGGAIARSQLAGLTYTSGGQIDSDLPVGQVAKTSPGSGASVPRGTTVTVWVSNGQAIAGSGCREREAQLQRRQGPVQRRRLHERRSAGLCGLRPDHG